MLILFQNYFKVAKIWWLLFNCMKTSAVSFWKYRLWVDFKIDSVWFLSSHQQVRKEKKVLYIPKGYDRLSFFNNQFSMIIEKWRYFIKKLWKNSCSFPMIIDFKSWTCLTFIIVNDDLFFWKVWDAIVWNGTLCGLRKKWVIVQCKVF